MRRLKQIIPPLLALATFAIALVTLLNDHSSEYGRVALPQGGKVELPAGTVKVFYAEPGQSAQQPGRLLSAPVRFQVTPATGGPALAEEATSGQKGSSETTVARSQDVGSPGSVAEIDVPAAGTYLVSGSSGRSAGSFLSFGTDPFSAVARRWKLFAGLVGGALLIALLPLPRRRRSVRGDPSGWPLDPSPPRTPYAG